MRNIKKFILKKSALLFFLFFFAAFFLQLSSAEQDNEEEVLFSSELGIAQSSPLGDEGGLVVPASCASNIHGSADEFSPCQTCNACGQCNAGQSQCGGACSATPPAVPFDTAWCQSIGWDYVTNQCLGYCDCNAGSYYSGDPDRDGRGGKCCPNGTNYNGTSCVGNTPPPPPPPGPVNGDCGAANGGWSASAPSSNLCDAGTATNPAPSMFVVPATSGWTWSCNGLNGGTTAFCQSYQTGDPLPDPTVTLTVNGRASANVAPGSALNMAWTTNNAVYCEALSFRSLPSYQLDNTFSGSKTVPNGNQQIFANSNSGTLTTYRLRCYSQNGVKSAVSQVTVTTVVAAGPPSVDLTINGSVASEITVARGSNLNLRWNGTSPSNVPNATSCTASGAWSGAKSHLGGSNDLPANATATYTLTCTGPGGSASDSVTVNVVDVPGAACVSVAGVPATVAPRQTFTAQVTVRNTGTNAWTSDATPHRLGSANPRDNLNWGLNRVGLPAGVSVAPNAQHTFAVNARAPASQGVYNFSWQMVEDGIAWFGPTCSSAPVNVVAPAAPIVDLRINGLDGPINANLNQPLNITWNGDSPSSVLNATGACSGTGLNWNSAKSQNGGRDTILATGNSTYRLVCPGANGTSGSDEVTVNVVGPAPDLKINKLDGPTIGVNKGDNLLIEWNGTGRSAVPNATSCSSTSGFNWANQNGLQSGGFNNITAEAGSTYELTCSGPGGIRSDAITVEVACEPSDGVFGACSCNTETKTRTNIDENCNSIQQTIDCSAAEKSACREFNWKEVAP